MPRRILFRGARVVDPVEQRDEVLDVLVEDEVVAEIGTGLQARS